MPETLFGTIKEATKRLGQEVSQALENGQIAQVNLQASVRVDALTHHSNSNDDVIHIKGLSGGLNIGEPEPPHVFPISFVHLDLHGRTVNLDSFLFVPTKPDPTKRGLMRYELDLPTEALDYLRSRGVQVIFLDDIVVDVRRAAARRSTDDKSPII